VSAVLFRGFVKFDFLFILVVSCLIASCRSVDFDFLSVFLFDLSQFICFDSISNCSIDVKLLHPILKAHLYNMLKSSLPNSTSASPLTLFEGPPSDNLEVLLLVSMLVGILVSATEMSRGQQMQRDFSPTIHLEVFPASPCACSLRTELLVLGIITSDRGSTLNAVLSALQYSRLFTSLRRHYFNNYSFNYSVITSLIGRHLIYSQRSLDLSIFSSSEPSKTNQVNKIPNALDPDLTLS